MTNRWCALRAAGTTARRAQALRDLFARATAAEHSFLLRLMIGELRQGALAGVMVDAIAAAADLPVAQVRSAAMYSKSLGLVARVAMVDGAEALGRFRLELFSPVAPMLAQTAVDVAEALREPLLEALGVVDVQIAGIFEAVRHPDFKDLPGEAEC